jgi:hypothetical protein
MAEKLRGRMGTNIIGQIESFEDCWVRIAENGVVKGDGMITYTYKFALICKMKDHYEICWIDEQDPIEGSFSNFKEVEQCIRAVKDNYRIASLGEKEEVIARLARSFLEGAE